MLGRTKTHTQLFIRSNVSKLSYHLFNVAKKQTRTGRRTDGVQETCIHLLHYLFDVILCFVVQDLSLGLQAVHFKLKQFTVYFKLKWLTVYLKLNQLILLFRLKYTTAHFQPELVNWILKVNCRLQVEIVNFLLPS